MITCKERMESHGGIAGRPKCCTFWPFMFYCFASRDCLKVAVSQFLTTAENNNIKQEREMISPSALEKWWHDVRRL